MPTRSPRARFLLALLLPVSAANAAPGADIVFIAPTNHTLPLAEFAADGQLSGGILRDLGEAIGARLERQARFLPLPGKRVAAALAQGQADAVCYVHPQWFEGDFHWSAGLLPNAGVVAARTSQPALEAIAQLADRPVGTVIGYRYPDFESALGPHFVRSDAPSMLANLHKLAAGRTDFAIVERMTLVYFQRSHPQPTLKVALQFAEFDTHCALSRRSPLPAAALDAAIEGLRRDGTLERIQARYR